MLKGKAAKLSGCPGQGEVELAGDKLSGLGELEESAHLWKRLQELAKFFFSSGAAEGYSAGNMERGENRGDVFIDRFRVLFGKSQNRVGIR